MTLNNISSDLPGYCLFPEYDSLYDLIALEVEELCDRALDFESDKWQWSKWSIRYQLSHMASLLYRWILIRWEGVVFSAGDHLVEDVKGLADSGFDRRMDAEIYSDLDLILEKLDEGIILVQQILKEYSIDFLRTHSIAHEFSSQWTIMGKAHPVGLELAEGAKVGTISLEATIRHMYYEEITHLYNIQRLKRAQGLRAIVEIPRVGYWVQKDWDRSEP